MSTNEFMALVVLSHLAMCAATAILCAAEWRRDAIRYRALRHIDSPLIVVAGDPIGREDWAPSGTDLDTAVDAAVARLRRL